MLSKPRLALAALGLLAFAWTLTALKPLPQVLMIAAGLAALLADRWAAPRVRPVTFLVVASLASLVGCLFAGPEALARAGRWLSPSTPRVMPVGLLLVGATLGIALFVLTFVAVLRPTARLDGARRIGLVAIVVTGLVASGLDALVL